MQVDEYRAAFDAIAWSDRDNILSEVDVELARQDEKWGEQNHPDVAPEGFDNFSPELQRASARERAEFWKTENAFRVGTDTLAWDGILLEEVYEALAEADPAKLRAELVQVAAVCVQWIAAIDRRIQ